MTYPLRNRFRAFVMLSPLLLLSACSFKGNAGRTEETRLEMEKLGNAFVVHYAYNNAKAGSLREVVETLMVDDPEPMKPDAFGKVIKAMTHDAWGKPIRFEYLEQPAGLRVRLTSAGPDRQMDTADDIIVDQTVLATAQ